jgi:intracellular sulfur oxidation DsrE/DsrF family protein
MKPLQFLTLLSCAIFILPLVALADADVGIIGLEVKDNVNVVYHIKVASVREDGVSKGVAELRHLLRLYDEVGVTRDKRDIHAVFDADGVPFVVSDSAYARLGKGDTNPNTALIAELIGEGVSVEVCSQRMERDKLTSQSLLPGVKMVLGGQPRVIDLELRGYAYFRF